MHSTPLTDRDKHILKMAGANYKRQGARETDIGQLFNLSATQFYQRVNELLDTEAAYAWDPMLVGRLRDTRSSRERKPRWLGSRL